MLIAHLPAGYMLTKWLNKTCDIPKYGWLGLLASLLPDIDILYFYFMDDRQTNHHHYVTHLPVFWGVLGFYSLVFIYLFANHKKAYFALVVFYANIFLHLLLDSYTGFIKWFYPVFYQHVNLIEVPASYDFWVWRFVLHWSFMMEVCIVVTGLWVLNKRRRCLKKS